MTITMVHFNLFISNPNFSIIAGKASLLHSINEEIAWQIRCLWDFLDY
jgi:hypothetical protein